MGRRRHPRALIAINLPVDYGRPGRPRVLRFDRTLEIVSGKEPFSAVGDSGSLIVDGDGWAVGLLFAGDGAVTYAHHVPGVLAAFGVDFL